MKWISVLNQLPQMGIRHRYLFINGKNEVTFGYAYELKDGWEISNSGAIWINDMDRETNELATHWMELPKGISQ